MRGLLPGSTTPGYGDSVTVIDSIRTRDYIPSD